MIFNYDKRTGASWGGIPVIAKNIKDGFINYFSKNSFGNDILDSAFGNVKSDTKIVDIISNMSDPSQKAALTNAMGSWWSNMSQQQTQAATVADAISNIGTQSFSAASALSKLGQIGSTVLSTLGTMAITTIILSGITLLIKGLYDLATAEERAIEKGKEARQTIADINKGYNDQKDYVDKNTERYNELRKGVDVSEKSGIENVSLSTEEFNEFLSINNELARLFPSIVSGYDAQGNAMLTLSSDADTATSSLQSLLEQERQLADFKVGEQLNDAVIGFATRYKQLQEDIKEQEQTIEASQQLQTAIQEKTGDGVDLSKLGISINGKNISYKFDQFDETQRAVADKIRQAYNEAAQGIGTVEWSGDYAITGELLGSLTYVSEDQLDEFEESFRARLSEMNLADIPEEIIDAMSVKNQDIQEIKADWNGLVPSILSQLNLYEDYQKLGDMKFGEQLQNAIANDISNIDFDNFEKIYGEGAWKEFGDNARGFVREHFLDPITNALMGEDGNFDKTKTDALNKLISFDGSKLTNEEYKDQVNTLVSSITDDAEVQKDIKVILGFQYYDEEGKNHWNVTKQRDELYEALGGFVGQADEKGNKEHHIKVGMNIRWDDFKSLSQEDLNAIQYAQANMSVDLSTIDTWEQLTEAIEKAKKAMSETPEIKKDATLSSIFSDENYQSAAEGYEKKLTSLTSALETLRSEGSLTAEQMRDLQEEFPDMTDFSEEGISKLGTKELSNWIDQFKSGWTDFSDEGIKQLDTYLANFTASYRKVAVTQQDAMKAVRESTVTDSTPGSLTWVEQQNMVTDGIQALKEKYGEDLNWNIVLALQDQFSGDTDALIEKYQDYKIVWDLEVNTEELQRTIDGLTAQRNLNSQEQGLNDAMGIPMTIEDYENDNKISDGLIKAYEGQLRRAREALTKSPENVLLQNKVMELQGAIFGERTNKAKNRSEMLKLPRKEFENIGVELARVTSEAERQIQNTENLGNIPTQEMYQRAIDSASAEKENLENTREEILNETAQFEEMQKKEFINNHQFRTQEAADAAWEEQKDSILQQNTEWQQFMADLDSNQDALDNNAEKIRNWKKAIDELPITKLQNIGTELSRATSNAEKEISNREAIGGDITKEMYQAAIDAARAEKSNLIQQQDALLQQMDDFKTKVNRDYYAENGRLMTMDELEKSLTQNTEWQQMMDDLGANEDSIDGIIQKIHDWQDSINNLKFDRLTAQSNEINRWLERSERELENPKTGPTAEAYAEVIKANQANIDNLQEQLDGKVADLDYKMEVTGEITFGSQAYEDAKSEIDGLKTQILDATDAQNGFVQSLMQLPVDNIVKQIDKYENALSELQEEQELNVKRGQDMTAEDYDEQIDLNKKILGNSKVADWLYGALDGALARAGYEETSELRTNIAENRRQNKSRGRTAEGNIIDSEKAKADLPIVNATKEMDELQRVAEHYQHTLDAIQSQGKRVVASDYDNLKRNAQQQIDVMTTIRDKNAERMRETFGTSDYDEYASAYTQAESTIAELTQKQYDWNKAIREMPLTDMQNQYTDLQTEATRLEDELNSADVNRKKVNADLYSELISNGDKQIKNLENQKRSLLSLQRSVEQGSEDWRNYQSQINDVDSSISSMQQNQSSWWDTMTSLASTNASQLTSVLSSALSEINSETGLTIDSMNELQRSFSDLAGEDVSSIFYQSSEGMKMNMDAAEALVDAEFELQVANQQEIISTYEKIAADEQATASARAQAEARIQAAQRELAMLQAQYDQQKEIFSGIQKFQAAQQTANAGADYETMQGYLKTQKENYDKGLTGTDEFKAYTEYFDRWGLDTVAAWDRMKDKAARYLTEDRTGMQNFMQDLVANGLATEENGFINLDLPNVEEAAQKMGMSTEWFMDMMGRAEDYGMRTDWIENELDGQLKIQEAIQNQIEAQEKLTQAKREGASQDIIDNAQDAYDQATASVENLNKELDRMGQRQEGQTANEFQQSIDNIQAMKELYDSAKTDAEKQAYKQAAEDYAKEAHLELDAELNIDQKSLQNQIDKLGIITPETAPRAADLGIGIERASDYEQLLNTLYSADQTGNADISSSLATLSGFTAEQLKQIDLNDGEYKDLFDGAQEAEQALDTLNTALGTTSQNFDLLAYVLEALGLTADHTTTEVNEEKLARDEEREFSGTQQNYEEIKAAAEKSDIGIASAQMRDAYQEEREVTAANEKYSENEENQKPVIDSVNGLQEVVSSIGEGIISAIGEVVTAISGEKQGEEITPVEQNSAQTRTAIGEETRVTNLGENVPTPSEVSVNATINPDLSKLQQHIEIPADVTAEQVTIPENIVPEVPGTVNVTDVLVSNTEPVQVAGEVQADTSSSSTVDYVKGEQEEAEDKEAGVNYVLEDQDNPENKHANVDYNLGHQDAPQDMTANVDYVLRNRPTEADFPPITQIVNVVKQEGKVFGTAFATGTAYDMWTGYRHSIGAWANGTPQDWRLPRDENALINEVGQESIVRDGRWMIVPGGPHVEQLKKGDIIFNAQQTRDLIETGKTARAGKIAHASGTAYNTMNAHVLGAINGMSAHGSGGVNNNPDFMGSWKSVYTAPETVNAMTKATQAATAATQANTGAKDKETAATENTVTSLDKFNAWLSSLFDWIEVRIERITHRMELAISKAENIGGSQTYQGKRKEYVGQVGYIGKNAYISDAMDENKKLQNTNTRAVPIYEAQAVKVAKRARKAGLITKKQRRNLVRKIKNGAMSIQEFDAELKKNSKGKETSKSESNRKTFVDAYKQWYDKARQCEAAIQDCIAKTKELEQTKLDNIVEEFESLANYADSVGKTSAALLSLNNTIGTVSYSKQNKNLYQDQINANRNMASYYSQQKNAYQTEMANAARIFGTDSNEYREAQIKFQEMSQALYEAQENAAKLTIELRKLDLKPIEYAMGRFEEFGKKLAGIVSLKEARGILSGREEETRINEKDYYKQIENNNDTIVELMEKVKIQQGWLDQGFYDQNGETIVLNPESDAYRELESQIAADNDQINQLLISNENLKKSIVTLRWEAFEDLQKKLNNATSDYEHLQGLINQEGLFDDNGKGWNLTDEGVANLTLIAAKMYTAEEQIKSYREALNRVQEEYENGNRSLQDYEETSRNHVETIQKLVDGNQNLKKSIIDTYKTQITNENNALVDLINKRKEAYDAKKKYYDYDKQLRQQNDDISRLRAESAALQGVSNQASQARLARINDELAQKEKDMADSVAQHRYEVGSEGYSKLADSAQESLSNTLAMVASSSTQQEIIVQQMLANVSAQYESAYDLIQQKIDETGTIISNTAEKQMQVNGEINDYLDQMVAKSDQLKTAWDNYVKLVTPSGQTMSEALTGFITLIDSGTRHPKENWEAFVEAVGGTISTEAFQVFCDTISQGIATETEQWNAFKAAIGGQIDDTVIRNLFDYINEHSGIAITDWQSFQQAVSQGKFDETELTNLYSYVNEIAGNSITDWQSFQEAVANGEFSQEQLKKIYDYASNQIKTCVTDWQGFQEAVANGEFSQEQLKKIYDYASDQTKASVTDWQGFQQAVADGKFSNEQLNNILGYASKTTGGLITNWETFESAVKGETPISSTVVDQALDTVQQKIDNIKKTWGEVKNETTGESKEGVKDAQTAGGAKETGQNVDTTQIQMDKTSSGQTVDQAAIDRENAREAAEEAARRAVEESNQRKAAKADAKAKADAAYAKYKEYDSSIQTVEKAVNNNKIYWDNWVGVMNNAKHGSEKWKDAAAKAKHHRLNVETGNKQLEQLRADQAAWLAEYNRLQSYYESLPSYKVGTKRTLEDELALTHDKEIVLGNGAVLRQLPQGSQVLPKIQADNIWKWSKIDPLKDMGKGIGATASVNTINNTGNNFYYDSLIHIDGNVDADVMDRLEDFGKALINNRNFQKNLTNVVTKEFVREGRKLGYK